MVIIATDCRSIYLGNDEWILEHKGNAHVRLGFARTASLPSNSGTQTSGRFFMSLAFPAFPALMIDTSDLSNNMGSFPPAMVIIFAIRDFDYFSYETQQRSQSAFSFQYSDSQSFVCLSGAAWRHRFSPGPKGSDF